MGGCPARLREPGGEAVTGRGDPGAEAAAPPPGGVARRAADSYGQILRSSALIGGASLITVLIGIVRTKAFALLLGPAGFGLMSLLSSIADLARGIAEMGVGSSGVRQIAAAAGSGDLDRVARTAAVLRRISLLLGLLGGTVLVLAAAPISRLTFGDDDHVTAVALLSLAVLFGCLNGGYGALVQGMRRIGDLARLKIIGALAGALVGIPLVYALGEDGVAPAIVAVSAASAAAAWWYSRQIGLGNLSLRFTQALRESGPLLKLGVAFMASALMITGSAYIVRLMLTREVGIDAAGLYQSAWTLGGLYVSFILQAMGADFYPRLTAVAGDDPVANRLVNEQAQVSLLLAGPGVLATLTFAAPVIHIFYSARFEGAVEILRWIGLGMALRVAIWPIGFIILAKGSQKLFFWSEAAWTLVHLGLAWVLIGQFGAVGAGMAFFGSYVSHGLLVYAIVRRLGGFRWSAENLRIGLIFGVLTAAVFLSARLLPTAAALAVGAATVLAAAIWSLRRLVALVGQERMPAGLARVLGRLRFLTG
jgi:enterobacterial common antigen flippase